MMTPNAAECTATPNPLPNCRFCGAVGVQTLMSRWRGLFGTVLLHPECEGVLKKAGVITETWWGERRLTIDQIDKTSRRFYAERGLAKEGGET